MGIKYPTVSAQLGVYGYNVSTSSLSRPQTYTAFEHGTIPRKVMAVGVMIYEINPVRIRKKTIRNNYIFITILF
jgi:hypothetical protein